MSPCLCGNLQLGPPANHDETPSQSPFIVLSSLLHLLAKAALLSQRPHLCKWRGSRYATPSMLLWHRDYFKLKAFEIQQMPFPIYLKAGHQFHLRKVIPYHLRQGVNTDLHLHKQTLLKLPLSPVSSTMYFLITYPQFIVPWSPIPLPFVKMVYKSLSLTTSLSFLFRELSCT